MFAIRQILCKAGLLSALLFTGAYAQVPKISVTPQALTIELDGNLSEPAWALAPRVLLVQQAPRPGAPTPYTTEVSVLVSRDTIYVGFRCVDPEPNKTAIHTMRRDGDLTGDDTVSIVLDTFGDRRTGYFFRINPVATRVDGLISDPESASLDWDGIWDARAARTIDGWTAEIAIPARTIGFSRTAAVWGVNFERFVPRERVTLRWASATLDSFLFDLSRTGVLEGGRNLDQGHGIELSPYAAGETSEFYRENGRTYQATAGGDVSWRMTPQLQSVFTVNTDFAETEVDARQINLTRFPLFFPEKRSFFLEGANQFEFGLGLQETFIPFFSRRIGLFEGAQVPINAGVKLNGRVGRWNIGFLDVQTRDANVPGGRVPSTNLLGSRVSYDLTDKLRVGTIVTHGDPSGTRSNALAGFDAVYRTSTFMGNKNFLLGGWTAGSFGDLPNGNRTGWGYKIDYPNDLLDCAHTLNHFGAALDPALGFLPRPGTQRLTASCSWQPRPSKDGPFRWVRQEFFENFFTRVSNAAGFLESWEYFMAPINVRLETGDRFEFNWVPTYEFLATPFEIVPGVVIPPGRYQFTRWRLEGQTSPHRAIQFGHTTWFGSFYNGDLTEWQNYLKWTAPRGRLQLELSTLNNFGHLPQGNFAQRLWQLQSAYAWNPNLILTSFIQYDSDSRNLGSNTRLRWTMKPGNDLFVIWNHGWQQVLGRRDLSLVPDTDLVAVKLRWTFRY
jgi:hypothetical protein